MLKKHSYIWESAKYLTSRLQIPFTVWSSKEEILWIKLIQVLINNICLDPSWIISIKNQLQVSELRKGSWYLKLNFWLGVIWFLFDERHNPQQKVTLWISQKAQRPRTGASFFVLEINWGSCRTLTLYFVDEIDDNILTNESMIFLSNYRWENLKLLNLSILEIIRHE